LSKVLITIKTEDDDLRQHRLEPHSLPRTAYTRAPENAFSSAAVAKHSRMQTGT